MPARLSTCACTFSGAALGAVVHPETTKINAAHGTASKAEGGGEVAPRTEAAEAVGDETIWRMV